MDNKGFVVQRDGKEHEQECPSMGQSHYIVNETWGGGKGPVFRG